MAVTKPDPDPERRLPGVPDRRGTLAAAEGGPRTNSRRNSARSFPACAGSPGQRSDRWQIKASSPWQPTFVRDVAISIPAPSQRNRKIIMKCGSHSARCCHRQRRVQPGHDAGRLKAVRIERTTFTHAGRSNRTMSDSSRARSKMISRPSADTSKSPMANSRPRLVSCRSRPVSRSTAQNSLCETSPFMTTSASSPPRKARRLAPRVRIELRQIEWHAVRAYRLHRKRRADVRARIDEKLSSLGDQVGSVEYSWTSGTGVPPPTGILKRRGSQSRLAAMANQCPSAQHRSGARLLVEGGDGHRIAWCWEGNASVHWNQAANQIAHANGLSMSANSRLLAVLNVAMADTAFTIWTAKR